MKFNQLYSDLIKEETTKIAIFSGTINGDVKVYTKSGIDNSITSLKYVERTPTTIEGESKNVYTFSDTSGEKIFTVTTPREITDLKYIKLVSTEQQVETERERLAPQEKEEEQLQDQ